MTEQTLGERVHELRDRAGFTQVELATAAGVSVDIVRKLEQGQRHSVSIPTLHALARALDTSPGELLGKPRSAATGDPNASGVRAIVRILTSVDDLLEPAEPAAVDLADVGRSTEYAWATYWAGRYGELAAQLPAALTGAKAAVHHASASQRPAAHELAAELYHLTGYTLVQLAQPDAAYTALRTSIRHADEGDDPLRAATSRGALAWLLLTDGRAGDAEQLAARAALEVEPIGDATAAHTSVWGGLLLTSATAAARAGNPMAAIEMVAEASAAADRNGGVDRTDYEWPFGTAQVVMQATDVALVGDDPERALGAARAMPTDAGLPLAARARHLADVAQAHQRLHRDREALEALLTIERIAPEWLRYQPLPRAITRELVEQERQRRNRDLREFANRIGVIT